MADQSKKSNKLPLVLFTIVALICIVVSVFAGLTYAASQSNTDVPVFSSIVETVEKATISDKDYAKMVTAQLAGEIDKMKNTTNPLQNFPALFKYTFNVKAEDNTSKTYNYSGSGAVDAKDDKVGFSLTVADSADTFDLVVLGTKTAPMLYFKTNKIGDFVGSTSANNKWVSFDVAKALKDFNVTTTSTTDPAEVEKTKKLIQSDAIINNFKRLPDQVFNGVRTNCFEINLDNAAIKQLEKDSTGTSTGDDSLRNIKFGGCFGRKDMLPYKINVDTTIQAESIPLKTVNVEVLFKDYNQPVIITAPKADMTLEELFQSIFSSQSGF